MMRTFEDKDTHDSLVRMMAIHFNNLGYTAIKADIEGYPNPDAIWWTNKPQEQRIPDLTCYKNDPNRTFIVLEAETCHSLTGEHTTEQWKLFHASATHNKGEFHVVVPKTCYVQNNPIEGETLAKRLAQQIGIIINQLWWPKS